MEHEEKWYNWKQAFDLRHAEKPAIAAKHDSRLTDVHVQFDNAESAGQFMKEVYLRQDGKKVFKAEKSFMNPRDPEQVPKDYSQDFCIVM